MIIAPEKMERTVARSSSNSSQPYLTEPTTEEIQQESHIEKVYQTYFSKLCKILPDEILPELVSCNVITIDELGIISAKETTSDRVRELLCGHVWKGICGGCPEIFTKLLSVMRYIGNDCEELSIEIRAKLEIDGGDMSRE